MNTHNIHLKYRIISIVSPGVALIVTFRGLNYRCHGPKVVRAIKVRLYLFGLCGGFLTHP